MTSPPEYSVLLLAWDDADPSVAVLGGTALPPTLPLVYQLAAEQPVLAVYPHLPATAEPPINTVTEQPENATLLPNITPDATGPITKQLAHDVVASAVEMAGVRLLPSLPFANSGHALLHTEAHWSSRIIGLEELQPTAKLPVVADSQHSRAHVAKDGAVAHSQWPTEADAPTAGWQAPAAPYLGAGSGAFFPPPPPAPPRAVVVVASTAKGSASISPLPSAQATAIAPQQPATTPPADAQLITDEAKLEPEPEQPAVVHPSAFDEPIAEVGPEEASDLDSPENNLTLDIMPPVSPVAAAAPASPVPTSPPAPILQTPAMDGLNFRMIQYARQAVQVVRDRQDFGVIYAPNWPAWLAALEIRNRSRLPLVLYVAALAMDFTSPAERGWLLELERMTLRRTTLALVPDDDVRRRVLAEYGDIIMEVRVVAAGDEEAVQRVLREVAVG
jgi:hypothetical protein